MHLVGGQGRNRNSSGGQQPPRGPNGPYRLRTGNIAIPPNMETPVRTAFERAETAVARAQSGNPNWRPTSEVSKPATTPQQLIAYANRVEVQANAEITRQIGNNGGPRSDGPRPPPTSRSSFNSDPIRRQVGLPELSGRAALSKNEGPVAAARIDGSIYVGVNSRAPSYSEVDRADANYFRDQLIETYPNKFFTANRGQKPNDFVYHAEATLLFRVWREKGGNLSGHAFVVRTDREMCKSCIDGLPFLGMALGNPSVRFVSPSGKTLYDAKRCLDGRQVMKKQAYFHDYAGDGWPDQAYLKPFFLAPRGNEWFYEWGNDSAGLYILGVEGTELLPPGSHRKDIVLGMTGNPEHGVMLDYRKSGTYGYYSKGDQSRLLEHVDLLHGTPMSIGLFIPFRDGLDGRPGIHGNQWAASQEH